MLDYEADIEKCNSIGLDPQTARFLVQDQGEEL